MGSRPIEHCPSERAGAAVLPAASLSAHPVGGGSDQVWKSCAQMGYSKRTAFMHMPFEALTKRRGTKRSPLDSFTYRKDS